MTIFNGNCILYDNALQFEFRLTTEEIPTAHIAAFYNLCFHSYACCVSYLIDMSLSIKLKTFSHMLSYFLTDIFEYLTSHRRDTYNFCSFRAFDWSARVSF